MTTLIQTCEGANAATVTNANCTNPTQWDTVTKSGTGTTVTFDNAHVIHGRPTSIKSHYATVSSVAFYAWKATYGTTTANAYVRLYVYQTAVPSVSIRLCSLLSGAGVSAGSLNHAATGALRTNNSSGGTIASTTATIPLNQWVRVEWEITGIVGATGTSTARFYSGANLETNIPDANATLSNAGVACTGEVNEFRVNSSAAVVETSALDFWFQDIAFSDVGQPGPLNLPGFAMFM